MKLSTAGASLNLPIRRGGRVVFTAYIVAMLGPGFVQAAPLEFTFNVPSVTATFDGVPQITGDMTIVVKLDSSTVPTTNQNGHQFQVDSATVTAPNLGLLDTAITSTAPIVLGIQDPLTVFKLIYLASNPGGGLFLWEVALLQGEDLPATDLGDLGTYTFPFSIQKDVYRLRTSLNGGAPITFANGSEFDVGQFVTGGAATLAGRSGPSVCGNSILEIAEQCDDGGTTPGDCCGPTCLFEPNGSACDDSDECTLDDACSIGACVGAPSPDTDGDAFCDVIDNCPFVFNPLQENADAFAAGDACQCGDVSGGGIVDALDLLRARQCLVGNTTGGICGVDQQYLDYCDVDGDAACTVVDLYTLDRAINSSGNIVNGCAGYGGP